MAASEFRLPVATSRKARRNPPLFSQLADYDLEQYAEAIRSVAMPCVVGEISESDSSSFVGGLPWVDPGFVWPSKNSIPLNFVGQIECSAWNQLPVEEGNLLFFYDNRHFGYSASDRGHAVVMHQQGQARFDTMNLPSFETRRWFGLVKQRSKPQVYQQVNLRFRNGHSLPSWGRDETLEIGLKTDADEEAYSEFCADYLANVQLGGYPAPIQSDEMERQCCQATGFGEMDQWRLLFQLFEVGDMIWGDAGALYWFIHQDDFARGRLDRVWMVSQCH